MTRARDLAWEALVEETAANPAAERGKLNAALKAIREASGITDNAVLADEIRRRSAAYRSTMRGCVLTPNALAVHWFRVVQSVPSRRPDAHETYRVARDEAERIERMRLGE